MTKLLALILAVYFLFSGSLESVVFTSGTGLYTVEIPTDAIPIKGEDILSMLDTEEGREILASMGISEEMLSSVDLRRSSTYILLT